jgi:putative colanic acid biosysnthesis UDP-glucose lipid carrier transferase
MMHPSPDSGSATSTLLPRTGVPDAPRAAVDGTAATHGHRPFRRAPPSLDGVVAAILEPAVSAFTWFGVHLLWDMPFTRASTVVLLLVLMLSFPGSARFRDSLMASAIGILSGWMWLLGFLAMFGFALDSWHVFDHGMLLAWSLGTPVVHWLAVLGGRGIVASHARTHRRRAIIVGAGALAAKTARALQTRPDASAEVLACFDDRRSDRLDPAAAAMCRGGLDAVSAYVQTNTVDDVYITLPLGSQPRIIQLLESLQRTTASIYLVPDVFGITVVQGRLQDLNGLAVVGLCDTPFVGVNEAVKRASDIVFALVALALFAPLLAAIAVGVRLSSPGPVIFRQRRNGLGGEEIVVYKFRSMRVTEDGDSVRQATRDDERVTRLGAFLRRTSLDELPQFVNVLQGRMSVVGPRPHAVAHNRAYMQLIKAYMVRHKVRPGITGWAQVNGFRGETDTLDKMQARVAYDLEYLRNWSLALDIEIILRTIRLLLGDRAAH